VKTADHQVSDLLSYRYSTYYTLKFANFSLVMETRPKC